MDSFRRKTRLRRDKRRRNAHYVAVAVENESEENLSTEQTGSQAPARLPLADGDRRRPQGDRSAPRPRPQAALGLNAGGGLVCRGIAEGILGRRMDAMAQGPAEEPHGLGQRPARLRRRAEFLRVAAAKVSRQAPAFRLQMARREDTSLDAAPRFGFTVTKKIANAVERNRIRRRLKEALRLSGALVAAPGCDYVFVARRAALTAQFSDLTKQMAEEITRIGRQGAAQGSPNRRNRPLAP